MFIRDRKKSCITSTQRMGYDPEFTFHAKKSAGGEATAEYESFPGLKYQVSAQVARRGGSYGQCEYMCTQGKDGCTGFSYAERIKVCMQTSQPLGYDDSFNYYEKTSIGSSEKRRMKERKETVNKQRVRKQWERTYVKKAMNEKQLMREAISTKEAEERFMKEAEQAAVLEQDLVKETGNKLSLIHI
eukprot:TRINITY_DN28485_c0_g1_i2.p1 TRINITY_DN28485_c0_g1~~TRINITY_DN28485_c0_g1_i2.p1  ORF type:complete len:195 (+),score=39.56 TRINITY_DN28485_c0_g1_i2:26-586(+)